MTAIAYEDWCAGSATSTSGFPSTTPQGGSINSWRSEQLADFAYFEAGGQCVAWWDEPRPLEYVALLDYRRFGGPNFTVRYFNTAGSLVDVVVNSSGFAYPPSPFVTHHHVLLPAPVMARGIRVSTGVPASVGRIWAGPLWRPSQNILRDWRLGLVDPASPLRTSGGQAYSRREQRLRRLRLGLSKIPFQEAFGTGIASDKDLQAISIKLGTTTPFVLLPRTTDAVALHRLGVYGLLTEPVWFDHEGGNRFAASFDMLEAL